MGGQPGYCEVAIAAVWDGAGSQVGWQTLLGEYDSERPHEASSVVVTPLAAYESFSDALESNVELLAGAVGVGGERGFRGCLRQVAEARFTLGAEWPTCQFASDELVKLRESAAGADLNLLSFGRDDRFPIERASEGGQFVELMGRTVSWNWPLFVMQSRVLGVVLRSDDLLGSAMAHGGRSELRGPVGPGLDL